MRKSRFTEEQIIKVLKEHAAGLSAAELCRKYRVRSRHSTSGDRAMAGWRFPMPQTQRPRVREPPAEETAGGVDAGCSDTKGDAGKKLLTPSLQKRANDRGLVVSGSADMTVAPDRLRNSKLPVIVAFNRSREELNFTF